MIRECLEDILLTHQDIIEAIRRSDKASVKFLLDKFPSLVNFENPNFVRVSLISFKIDGITKQLSDILYFTGHIAEWSLQQVYLLWRMLSTY